MMITTMMMVPLGVNDDDSSGCVYNDAYDDDDYDGSDDDMAMLVARRSGMHKFCGLHHCRFQILHNVSIWLCVS